MSFAGMTLDKCIVLRIGTLTRCPLCRESHTLCRSKNPAVISIWLLVGFNPATLSVQSTLADNTRKRIWQYIEKERKKPSVRLSVRLFATLLGCLVCEICNSKSFHSFLFKLCIMIVHTLKMCTFYYVHSSYFFSFLTGVELRHFFLSEMLRGA